MKLLPFNLRIAFLAGFLMNFGTPAFSSPTPTPTTTTIPTPTVSATTTVTATPTPTPQPPTVTTGEAIVDPTSDFACTVHLSGTVNANALTTTVWFEYGRASGSYDSTTATHTVSGTSDTAISDEIEFSSTHCWTETYYYRLVAQNNAGISYGNENSFDRCYTDEYEDCSTCFVSGYVTDAISGKGIENASILFDGVKETVTDETGYYDYNSYNNDYSIEVTALANGYIASIGYFSCSWNKCHECTTSLYFELQPVSSTCSANSIIVSSDNLILNRKKSLDVTVTVKGENDCLVDGETVTATINNAGKKRISILPKSTSTDENGQATFTITAKNKTGNVRITFKAGNVKKTMSVKVRGR